MLHVAYYEQLAKEFVPIRHAEIFLMKDDKFYLNEWMDTFIWLSNQDSSRKITKWGHYNLNYTTIIIKNTCRIDKTIYMCRIIID